jgi:DNA-directed RNA polymerase subunit RPC12/RpoP
MKFGKLFRREKTKPEETIACPYCGHKNLKKYVENAVLHRNTDASRWMGKFRCWSCKKLFWVVVQDGEIRHVEPFSDARFA